MSIHVGIFGPSLCGKSYVGKALSREAWRLGRASLVCDPNGDEWGAQALVFPTLDERFRRVFWARRNLSVFIDEATLTVARDVELIDLFTRGRHQGHQLFVLGHRAVNLLPIMRDQFGTLFLFRCSPSDAKLWAEDWGEPRILEATGLPKYEFILARKFAAPDGQHLVTRGRFPAS